MSGIFSSGPPVVPLPPPPPAAPSTTSSDEEVKKKTNEELEKAASVERKAGKGRSSTILTGGLGLEDDDSISSKKYLLGR